MNEFKKAIAHLELLNFLFGEVQQAVAEHSLMVKNSGHARGRNLLAAVSLTELAIYLRRDRFHWPRALNVALNKFDGDVHGLSADAKLLLFEKLVTLRAQFAADLNLSKFSPAARVEDLATFLVSSSCATNSDLAKALNVSVTTAGRWLQKCASLGLVRHVKVAEVSYWIVESVLGAVPRSSAVDVGALRAAKIQISRGDMRWAAPSRMFIDSQFLPVVEPPF